MTTTNDGGIHPMVMKAARALAAYDGWDLSKTPHADYIEAAQAALTECGALECLEALERLRGEWDYQCSKGNVPEGRVEAETADKAIAKAKAVEVYGSAP
jgi:hypothetical protein